jgi:hypothetical protein
MTSARCEAIEFPGRMICPRCDQSWPGNRWSRERPYCKSKASPPINVNEMISAVRRAVDTEIDSQVTTVKAKFRTEPYRPAMRHIAVLSAVAAFLERILDDEQIMTLLKQGQVAMSPTSNDPGRDRRA